MTREFQKNIYFCFTDYAKAFDYVDHNKLWKILKVMGVLDHLTCFLRSLYVGQEATVIQNWERNMTRLYIRAAYLTYIQSTSCEMPGWMNHKPESRLPGEISTTSDMQMIQL